MDTAAPELQEKFMEYILAELQTLDQAETVCQHKNTGLLPKYVFNSNGKNNSFNIEKTSKIFLNLKNSLNGVY